MQRKLKKAVISWLNAESGADSNRAEAALRRVFLRLPRAAPPPALLAGVLARLGMAPADLLVAPGLTPRWKGVLAVCFALVALVGGVVLRLLWALWTGVGPGKGIDLVAAALVGLTARLADGLAVWGTLSDVARIVSASLSSPQMMAAIAAAALVSAVALRLLHGLLISDRNPRYA